MTKYCKNESCRKELVRRENEDVTAFNKRKYCDKNCAQAHQKENGHWRNDLYLGKTPRGY